MASSLAPPSSRAVFRPRRRRASWRPRDRDAYLVNEISSRPSECLPDLDIDGNIDVDGFDTDVVMKDIVRIDHAIDERRTNRWSLGSYNHFPTPAATPTPTAKWRRFSDPTVFLPAAVRAPNVQSLAAAVGSTSLDVPVTSSVRLPPTSELADLGLISGSDTSPGASLAGREAARTVDWMPALAGPADGEAANVAQASTGIGSFGSVDCVLVAAGPTATSPLMLSESPFGSADKTEIKDFVSRFSPDPGSPTQPNVERQGEAAVSTPVSFPSTPASTGGRKRINSRRRNLISIYNSPTLAPLWLASGGRGRAPVLARA